MIHFFVDQAHRDEAGSFRLTVEFALFQGSLTGIAGPSGSGKTTLLRCLAGLETPQEGFIRAQDTWWFHSGTNTNLRPQQRSVGLVFQDYALFPHLTALENVQFAGAHPSRAREWLDLVGLAHHANKRPWQLSGGQNQRVALVRALARQPTLLLLDEPFSALDEPLRAEIGDLILDLQKQTGVTTLLVTHSRQEIDRLCSEVLELRQGQLVR